MGGGPPCVPWCFFNYYFNKKFFGHTLRYLLVPRPGIELPPPALEGRVLTTWPLGKPYIGVLNSLQSHPFPCRATLMVGGQVWGDTDLR